MVANVAYLPKLYIHHYCHVEIVIFKKSRILAKTLKTEGLGENKIAYMKHIKYSHDTWVSYLCQRI